MSPHLPSRWLGLFGRSYVSVNTVLKHFSPVIINGIAKTPIDVVKSGNDRWSKFLVGSFTRKKLPFFLEKVLKNRDLFELLSDKYRFFIETKNCAHR